jgi:hypothetical protein
LGDSDEGFLANYASGVAVMACCVSGKFYACEERADEEFDREFGGGGVEYLFEFYCEGWVKGGFG